MSFTEKDFGQVKEDAVKYREDYESSSEGYADDDVVVVPLMEGDYTFRVYPELVNGRLTIMRRTFVHFIKGVGMSYCIGDGCSVCAQAKRLRDANYKDAYKFEASEYGLMTATLYDAPKGTYDEKEASENGVPLLGQPVILSSFSKGIYATSQFLSNLDPSTMSEMFDPDEERICLLMSINRGNKSNYSMQIHPSMRKEKLPPLPDDWVGLENAYINDTKIFNKTQQKKLVEKVSQIVASNMEISDPVTDTGVAFDDEGTQNSQVGRKCPSNDEALQFGKKPSQPHPDCMLCPIQTECLEQTILDEDIPF